MMGEVLVAAGAVLAALAALGAVRLDGLLAKMHALTKAATGAITLALVGTAVALWSASSLTTLALALALQLFTFPVGANLVAHAVYVRDRDRGLLEPPIGAVGDDVADHARPEPDALGGPEAVD
jgi:monovalent cation/proton antiporter MnhG/PhaG subunit